MKQLRSIQGGYPRRMDYLLNMQSELLAVANSMFGKLNQDMVLSGCDLTDHGNGTVSIGPGIVFVSGEVIRFDGAANIPSDLSKAFLKDAIVYTEPKIFADGLSKQVYAEAKAIIGDVTSITQIKVSTELYTLATYIRDVAASYAVKGEYKDIYDFDGTFLTNFDSTGLGITARYQDWALDNGENGTPGSVGRVLISVGTFTDPVTGQQTVYEMGDKVGERMHKLTIPEMPNHSHTYDKPRNENNVDAGGNSRFGAIQNGNTGGVGGDQPHNNMQPSMAVYRIIKIR